MVKYHKKLQMHVKKISEINNTFGSYIKLKDTFIEASRFAKILVIYLPKILLLIAAFYMINASQNYVYIMSGKLLILVNGLSVFLSIIFNKGDVF